LGDPDPCDPCGDDAYDQPRPKFHCVKQLYTPQFSVLFTVHTIVSYINIADLIGGTRGVYRAGYPYAWAPLDVKKIVLISTVKKIC